RILTKILNELQGANPKPVMLPLDVVRLADAAPLELDNRQTYPLGRMLLTALQGTESRAELMAVLRKGTRRLGGTDPVARRAAATVLAAAELWTEAKEFGLQDRDIPVNAAIAAESLARSDDHTWATMLELVSSSQEEEK